MMTNSQYQAIMREYDQIRFKNQRLSDQRKTEIFAKIPAYKELSDSVSALCVEQTKKMIQGDDEALGRMKEELRVLSQKKKDLLAKHGYPRDYLDAIYDCPDCKDTGILPDKNKCSCMRQRMIFHVYEQSGLSQMIKTENFDNLSLEYYDGEDRVKFEKAIQSAKNFISLFGSHYQNLFFYGTVGTGKTFLSCCIAKELLEKGHSVMYFSSKALFDKISEFTFHSDDKESLMNFYGDLYQCDLLIIDDLGTEMVNSFVASELFSFLNERHLRQKSTIISSNISLEELRDFYSERLFSRIISNYELLKFTGKDIRMHKKRIANRK